MEGFASEGIAKARQQFRSFKGSSGLVPKAAKHGDVICILGNAEVPFVLRPIDEHYEMIGDGYIDLGEESEVGSKPQLQTFVLQ